MNTTQPIRSKKQVSALSRYFLLRGEHRNRVLVVMGVHTALRIGDLLRLRWRDVYDFDLRRVRKEICVTEKKTKKRQIVALNRDIAGALALYAAQKEIRPDGALFESRRTGEAISRIQAYRVIRAAADALKMQPRVSCHSLRKTFGYHAWKDGVSPVVLMDIFNHSSFDVTRRYLGVTQDDKNDAYLKLSFSG
ncbi:MAG: tyrosine-type recombinase/integrase [Oscillospiraceae bacterium]|jgi:integrase|nr:tyrosine-type recombinase/integrase [Oscillospiraceae bacterium]